VELAELFDRFHFAFDPTQETALQAEQATAGCGNYLNRACI